MNPPGATLERSDVAPAWKSTTAITATARKPSRAGWYSLTADTADTATPGDGVGAVVGHLGPRFASVANNVDTVSSTTPSSVQPWSHSNLIGQPAPG